MKYLYLFFVALALLACNKTTPPVIDDGDELQDLSKSHTETAVISPDDSADDRSALFKELKPDERIMAHMPKISCAQTSLLAGQLSITCRLLQNRVDFKPDSGTTVSWTYSHASRAFNPTITGAETSPIGKFDFSDPDNWKNFYFADTGRFGATIKVDGRSFPISHEKVQVLGETCTVPIPGLINMRNPGTGFATFADNGGVFNINPPTEGGRFIVAGARGSLQANNTNPSIIALNGGKADFRGLGLRIHVMDSASLAMVAPATATAIFAGPFANVPNDASVYRFETDLGLCERQ